MPDQLGGNYRFHLEMDTFQSEQARIDFYKVFDIRNELYDEFKDLLLYIRNNYLEINLDETSNAAFEGYKLVMKKV